MFYRIVLVCMLAAGLTGMASAQVQEAEGIVDKVQLIDASELGGDSFLILRLEDDRNFQLPDQQQLPAGQGTRVAIRYLVPDEPDLLPEACSVTVLAVPIGADGEEVMQEAARPFQVYRNSNEACQ